MKIIVSSPPKVGSTWLVKILCNLVGVKGAHAVPEEYRENPKTPSIIGLNAPSVQDYLVGLAGPAVFKSHSLCPDWAAKQNCADDIYFFTILRDPRDALVSLTFHLTNTKSDHPIAALSTRDRLLWILEKRNYDIGLYESWTNAKNVHKFRYENLLAHPRTTLITGFRRYGLPLEVTHETLAALSFESMSGGRARGVEDPNAFLRKGTSGDWKNHFDDEVVAKFKTAQDGRWNKILLQLDYEKDPDWQMTPQDI
jgi:hypothetical protein